MNKIRDTTSSSHWPEDIHREQTTESTNTIAPIRQSRSTVLLTASPADILPRLTLYYSSVTSSSHAALSCLTFSKVILPLPPPLRLHTSFGALLTTHTIAPYNPTTDTHKYDICTTTQLTEAFPATFCLSLPLD